MSQTQGILYLMFPLVGNIFRAEPRHKRIFATIGAMVKLLASFKLPKNRYSNIQTLHLKPKTLYLNTFKIQNQIRIFANYFKRRC